MPAPNVFDGDLFTLATLTAAVNHMPIIPNRITSMGIFEEEGIPTVDAWIEREAGKLKLVANKERGASGQNAGASKRNGIPFRTLHLPQNDYIFADEVQGVREFGTESNLRTIEGVRNKKLKQMKDNLDATTEFHRVGALRGKIIDADGATVIDDLFDRFKLEKTEKSFGLSTNGAGDNDFRNKARSIQREVKQKLGGNVMIRGWSALCGIGFYDKLVAHEAVKKAFDRWNESAALRDNMAQPFPYAGITWEEYDAAIGSEYLIPEDHAILIPLVSGLCVTRFAPAPWFDTVNTVGLPYYSRDGKRTDEALELKVQSNPLHICTVPDAIFELKI